MPQEVVTIFDIKERTAQEVDYIADQEELTGFDPLQGPPNASIVSSNSESVTLDVNGVAIGTLNTALYRLTRDVQCLAELLDYKVVPDMSMDRAFYFGK